MSHTTKLALACVAASLAASPAAASVTITGIAGNPGYQTGRVIYTPGGLAGSAARTSMDLNIGRFRLTGIDNATMAAVTFDTYCIDIFHALQKGSFELQAFTLGNLAKDIQIKTLLSHTAGFIASAPTSAAKKDVSAAIQMAVWEIVNESGSSGYSLGSGLFQISGSHGTVIPNARGMAQGYLDNLGSWSPTPGYKYTMMSAVSPLNNQRQIFLAAGAVPEPSAWALLIAGFGATGAAMRRRRRSTSLSFA